MKPAEHLEPMGRNRRVDIDHRAPHWSNGVAPGIQRHRWAELEGLLIRAESASRAWRWLWREFILPGRVRCWEFDYLDWFICHAPSALARGVLFVSRVARRPPCSGATRMLWTELAHSIKSGEQCARVR